MGNTQQGFQLQFPGAIEEGDTGSGYEEPTLLLSWFSPESQRVLIAALAKKIKYKHVNAMEIEEDGKFAKLPLLMEKSPQGMVPVILHKGTTIEQSLICIEYLDEAFPSKDRTLLLGGPRARALQRMWAQKCETHLRPNFIKALYQRDEEERSEAMEKLTQAVLDFGDAIRGYYFAGDHLTMVDIVYFPFLSRLFVLRHFHGYDIPAHPKLTKWLRNMEVLGAVKQTMAPEEELIQYYHHFVHGSARTVAMRALENKEVPP